MFLHTAAISSWGGDQLPNQCQQALEEMRGTRGLIVDVRLNGGGSDDLFGEQGGDIMYGDDQPRGFAR